MGSSSFSLCLATLSELSKPQSSTSTVQLSGLFSGNGSSRDLLRTVCMGRQQCVNVEWRKAKKLVA